MLPHGRAVEKWIVFKSGFTRHLDINNCTFLAILTIIYATCQVILIRWLVCELILHGSDHNCRKKFWKVLKSFDVDQIAQYNLRTFFEKMTFTQLCRLSFSGLLLMIVMFIVNYQQSIASAKSWIIKWKIEEEPVQIINKKNYLFLSIRWFCGEEITASTFIMDQFAEIIILYSVFMTRYKKCFIRSDKNKLSQGFTITRS